MKTQPNSQTPKFSEGDTVEALKFIRRVDGRACLQVGQKAKITRVWKSPDSETQIVDIKTDTWGYLGDIVILEGENPPLIPAQKSQKWPKYPEPAKTGEPMKTIRRLINNRPYYWNGTGWTEYKKNARKYGPSELERTLARMRRDGLEVGAK